MKKTNKSIISKICILIGIVLFVFGTLVLTYWQWNIYSGLQKSKELVEIICDITPEPQGAVLEERKDDSMPVLAVDGTDFVGILEMPLYNSALPVCADWGNITKYPCKFNGSVYNGTMQIGLTSQKGQYDFYREISVGDTVLFTDVEGNCYTYKITNLQYEKDANKATIEKENSPLTLFVKNIYAFEYLVISCDIINN